MTRRASTWTRRTARRPGPRAVRASDRRTLAIVGVICAVAGFFVLGIVLGPVAMVCGWLAMGRRVSTAPPVTGLVAFVLGAIDTLVALVYLTGGAAGGPGL